MSNFYCATLRVIDGERSYEIPTPIKAVSISDAEKKAEEKAKNFWDGGVKEDDNSYSHFGGETLTRVRGVREITEDEYNVLIRFL